MENIAPRDQGMTDRQSGSHDQNDLGIGKFGTHQQPPGPSQQQPTVNESIGNSTIRRQIAQAHKRHAVGASKDTSSLNLLAEDSSVMVLKPPEPNIFSEPEQMDDDITSLGETEFASHKPRSHAARSAWEMRSIMGHGIRDERIHLCFLFASPLTLKTPQGKYVKDLVPINF